METTKTNQIARWLVDEGLRGTSEKELIEGFCEKLGEAGFPLMRGNIIQRTLHPVIAGHGYEWNDDGNGVIQETWQRAVDETGRDWGKSPFHHMLSRSIPKMREHLAKTNEPSVFPMINKLRERGATDYLAYMNSYAEHDKFGDAGGMLSSWTARGGEGFSDEQVESLEDLLRLMALAFKGAANFRIARTLLETYLGRDAGQRVIKGDIVRGSVETIRAVLWYSDLRGFTKIAESLPSQDLIQFLNDYFECLVDPVHERGGQVLKFMGDSVLATFPVEDGPDVCRTALDATDEALRRVQALNERRKADGLVTTDIYVALHLGDVMYGNIGSRERLDFTVVGPAVNEVTRIEDMCRTLEQAVVISSAFADAAGRCTDRLVSLGRYALRGVRQPQELFTLVRQDVYETMAI